MSKLHASLVIILLWAALPGTGARAEGTVENVLAAIVGVRAEVPDSARTAASLGTERVGSGVLIDTSGLIVTIGYLILEARTAEIMLADGRRLPAEIVGYENTSGFGLLRAIGEVRVRPIRLGDSSSLRENAPVLAVSFGGPGGVRPAAVTSRREFAGYWEYLLDEAIFTSPPHPAYGGAALLDGEGRLLGIGSLAVSDARPGEFSPGNLFVPIDALKSVIGELLIDGRPRARVPPWLGVFTNEERERLFVAQVARDGPAERAGIVPGDVIERVAGKPVVSMADFYRKVRALGEAGVTVPLTVSHNGERRDVDIVSADRYRWLRLAPSN